MATQKTLGRASILDHVGNTPLVELPRLATWAGVPEGVRLFAKVEALNPGGSCKDRIAIALLDDAEKNGLRPGGIVVEATSGNTGIALAQACAVRGYRLHIVASEKVSEEKVRIVEAFGATVHRTPIVEHGHPDHYTEVAPRLAKELGGHYLAQFENHANIAAHERITGPELLEQAARQAIRIDAFVAGVGTGGTITGIARHLARASPATRIILADPQGSILAAGGRPRGYLVEGIGDDAVPALYDTGCVADAVTIDDETSFRFAVQAARLEGVLVGGSSGSHLAAACQVAREAPSGTDIVTILPDTGRNYLSTFLDPAWCRARGLHRVHDDSPPATAITLSPDTTAAPATAPPPRPGGPARGLEAIA